MKKREKKEKKKLFTERKKIIFILGVGLLLRLILARGLYNFDVLQWIQIGSVARTSLNIYSHNQFYNYSPLWFFVLGILDRGYLTFPVFPFSFVVRFFLSLIDVATFFLLYKIAIQRKLPPLKTAVLFFLNPVTIIITGHHGQFDNMAIFFLLLALYYTQKKQITKKAKNKIVFLFLTLGLVMKHVVIFQVLYFFLLFYKNRFRAILLFSLALAAFLLILFPFFIFSGEQIIKRVFLYGGTEGLYGMTYFIGNIFSGSIFAGPGLYQIYKVVFLLGFLAFVFFIRPKDIARGVLLSMLFFLTFTSGIGAQYFMLPIAFGVLFPTRWFYLYSMAVTLFFLGSADELNIYTFKIFEWNTVWLFVILWFFSEFVISFKPLERLFKRFSF